MSSLADILTAMMRRIAEIERRQEGQLTQGTVHAVDPKAGTVRLKLGETDGEPFLSPAIPYAQVMGALKLHTPPSVGQQMTMISGSGDYRQGLAIPMTQSEANKSPSEAGDEHVLTFGEVRAELRGALLKVSVGAATVEISPAGLKVEIGDTVFDVGSARIAATTDLLHVVGSSLRHNAKSVGDTHEHRDVTPGPALTGPPA